MEIKATDSMLVLSAARRLTIPDVRTAAADLTPRIEADATRCGMQQAGPWVFVAHGLPRDSKTLYDVRFCLPVASRGHSAPTEFELLELEPVMVASTIYQGSLRGLFTKGYGPLVAEIESSRHVFSGESREIYHQWQDGARYQRIELQFGLAR